MSTDAGRITASSAPIPIAMAIPTAAVVAERASRTGQPITSDIEVAISGVMRGAINMAPMTTAVESVKIPVAAITDERDISVTNRTSRRCASSPSINTFW